MEWTVNSASAYNVPALVRCEVINRAQRTTHTVVVDRVMRVVWSRTELRTQCNQHQRQQQQKKNSGDSSSWHELATTSRRTTTFYSFVSAKTSAEVVMCRFRIKACERDCFGPRSLSLCYSDCHTRKSRRYQWKDRIRLTAYRLQHCFYWVICQTVL